MSQHGETQVGESSPGKQKIRNDFISGLLGEISDPIHRRIVEKYRSVSGGNDPVKIMEDELGAILLEMLEDES